MARGKYALKRDENIKKLRRELETASHKAKVATENLEITRLALSESRKANWKLKRENNSLKLLVVVMLLSTTASIAYILHNLLG